MVAPNGIEPSTQGFSVPCSTDWATEPNNKWRSRRELNSRSSAWQADVITATPRDHKWLRKMDLNQRPPGYEPGELPNCSIPRYYKWRRKRDSNPRAVADLLVFKTSPFNQTWVFLQNIKWCLRPDLNRHGIWLPQDFKSCASTNFATQAQIMVSCTEFESVTLWLKVRCSTGWANRTCFIKRTYSITYYFKIQD